MSFIWAFVAFAALIILHEFGHFIAAKAVGMRVERFSLFFPPAVVKLRRGETSYEVGAIPLGGFVKITGMNPEEEIAPDVLPRAYFKQPVWKRVVTIAAGPAMNVLIAIVLIFVLFAFVGVTRAVPTIEGVDKAGVAAKQIRAGDKLISVNGVGGEPADLIAALNATGCAGGAKIDGCLAEKRSTIEIDRGGRRLSFAVRPRYDAKNDRLRIGLTFGSAAVTEPVGEAAGHTLSGIWNVTKMTLALPARVFDAEKRKEISSAVGGYERTRAAFQTDAELVIQMIALISLSLAIINLFPFLPLDGGHIFWALAEKVRGRPIPTAVLERSSVIGIALIAMLFVVGLTNDIDRFRNGGFGP
ncbi:MAG: M50 family metallopeptidase [Solirubrobacterales bacterium]